MSDTPQTEQPDFNALIAEGTHGMSDVRQAASAYASLMQALQACDTDDVIDLSKLPTAVWKLPGSTGDAEIELNLCDVPREALKAVLQATVAGQFGRLVSAVNVSHHALTQMKTLLQASAADAEAEQRAADQATAQPPAANG